MNHVWDRLLSAAQVVLDIEILKVLEHAHPKPLAEDQIFVALPLEIRALCAAIGDVEETEHE